MRRIGWSVVAGFGVAGLLFASPAVLATEGAKEKSGESGHMSHDSSATSSGTSSGKESEARGSGQAGTSTGARPGEVTGSATGSSGTSEREAAKAATASNEVSGKVEKYDREKRTLSLEDSDKKLKVTDDTQVMKDGNKISPGQIMEGDEVRASFSGSGDVVEVLILEVTPATPGSGTGSGATPPATGGSEKASGHPSDASSGGGAKTPTK